MKLTLDITESLWQYDLDLFNATQAAQVERANEQGAAQHARIMTHTPELQRTPFVPVPNFTPLTIDQYVANALKAKEAAIESAQDAAREQALLSKFKSLSGKDRDALLAQADALA